jgi:uncharacterized protein YqgQ
MDKQFNLLEVHNIPYAPLQLFKNKVGTLYQKHLIEKNKHASALTVGKKEDNSQIVKMIEDEKQLTKQSFTELHQEIAALKRALEEATSNKEKSEAAQKVIVKALMQLATKIDAEGPAVGLLKEAEAILNSDDQAVTLRKSAPIPDERPKLTLDS